MGFKIIFRIINFWALNVICLFKHFNGNFRGKHQSPKIFGTTKSIDINFLQMLVFIRRNAIKKFGLHKFLGYKLHTKVLKIPISGNATSGHANFTKFCRSISIDIKIDPENLRLFLIYRTICKIPQKAGL